MKKIIMLLAAVAICFTSAHAERKLTRAENDSIVQALATIWGKYLSDKAAKSSDTRDNDEYLRGLTEALEMAHKNDSYYLGLQDGVVIDSRIRQIEQMAGIDIDRSAVAHEFKRKAKGRGSRFTPETADRYMNYIITALQADADVKKDSEKFLDAVEKRPGVKKSLNGLMWEVKKEGKGKCPQVGVNDVSITYIGSLYNGKVFDNSHATKPVRLDMKYLIGGFAEGLSMMVPGSTYRLYIPAYLAYGEQGVPGVIPPNAALEFEVTLHEVLPRNATAKQNQ